MFSIHGSYYSALSYDLQDVLLLFTFTKVEVVWFHTLVSDQSLALLHVLCINYLVADLTFGL